MLLPHACFLAVWLACASANGDVTQMSELCPYSSFCTVGPKRQIKSDERMSCCLPCSCSDMCTVTGNCCPDKPAVWTNTTNVVHAILEDSCKPQTTLYSKWLNRTTFFDTSMYRVMDRCPYNNDGTSDDCYTHSVRDVNDLMFVSDAETNDVYMNRFCARCNGVTDVVAWNLLVRCPPGFSKNIRSFEERDAYILETCNVASFPPSRDIGLHSVCYSFISKCNETGQWNIYNQRLDELCQKYNTGYLVGDKHVTYFANVYCYMCNVHSGHSTMDLCPAIDFLGGRSTVPHGFTSLLRYKQRTLPLIEDGDTQCAESDVMDPFLMTCTDLLCPIGLLPSYGSCIQIFDDRLDMFLKFQINMKLPSDDNTRLLHSDLLMGVYSLIQPAILAGCGFCETLIYKLETHLHYVADIVLYTTDQCHFVDLVKHVSDILGKRSLYIHLNNTNMNITGEFVLQKVPDTMITNIVEMTATMRRGIHIYYFDWDMLTCPTIVYKPDHLRSADVPLYVVENVLRKSRNRSDDDFQICLDVYLNIKAKLENVAPRLIVSPSHVVCILLLVCGSICHLQ